MGSILWVEGAGLSAHIGKLPNPSKAGLGNSLKDNGLAGTSQNLQPLQGRGGGGVAKYGQSYF